jgi:hypothetical protein
MPNTLTLDISNTEEVTDDLYEAILYAFCDKAERMGIDPATVLFDEWTITTTVKEYENA